MPEDSRRSPLPFGAGGAVAPGNGTMFVRWEHSPRDRVPRLPFGTFALYRTGVSGGAMQEGELTLAIGGRSARVPPSVAAGRSVTER